MEKCLARLQLVKYDRIRYNSDVILNRLVSGGAGLHRILARPGQTIENKEGMLSCRGVNFLFQRLLLRAFNQTIPI